MLRIKMGFLGILKIFEGLRRLRFCDLIIEDRVEGGFGVFRKKVMRVGGLFILILLLFYFLECLWEITNLFNLYQYNNIIFSLICVTTYKL